MDSKLFTLHTIETLWNKIKNKFYVKSANGIPKSDLDTTVQSSLSKADSALQEHQDISGKQDKSTAVTHSANTAVGSATKPVYVAANGIATPISHSINSDVPANAKFTDTTYGDATESTHGLMSAADKAALDSISTMHINFNTGSTVVGVKFKVNRVSANFIIMENNGRRASLSVSFRNNLDAKATAYVSGNTDSEYKMYVDNHEYIYVLFKCAEWSYITCTSTVRIENMEVWRGAAYPTDLKSVEMDIRVLLDSKNFSAYALAKDGTAKKAELLSSGQMRTAYCHNDDATFSNGHVWFKIGTAILSGGYGTCTTTFLGICGYGKHALYTARIRLTSAGNAVESISFLESGRTGGMPTGLFRIVAINGEKGVTFELWAKGDSQWEGTRVVILNEMRLEGYNQSNFWTLTSRGNADAKTAPTSGNMFVDSSDSSICATATNASNATTWHGLIDDTQTKNLADSWLLVKTGNRIQHRLSSELVVKEAATLTDSGWIIPTFPSGIKNSTIRYRKQGKIVSVSGYVIFSEATSAKVVLTLPEGYRPPAKIQQFNAADGSAQPSFLTTIDTNGKVSFVGKTQGFFTTANEYYIHCTFFVD